jgi:phage baseplate assembly protein W
MATISFKNVGVKQQTALEAAKVAATPPTAVGIKTPLSLGKETLLQMTYNVSDQVSDNLRNLLQTNWGERVGQFYFGANLRPITTEISSQEDFDSEAVVRIKNAVQTWMPYVDLIDYVSEIDHTQNISTGIIRINVTYNIPSLNVTNKKIQIVLYVI